MSKTLNPTPRAPVAVLAIVVWPRLRNCAREKINLATAARVLANPNAFFSSDSPALCASHVKAPLPELVLLHQQHQQQEGRRWAGKTERCRKTPRRRKARERQRQLRGRHRCSRGRRRWRRRQRRRKQQCTTRKLLGVCVLANRAYRRECFCGGTTPETA